MPKSTARIHDEPSPSPAVSACSAADAMQRAAAESVRQHERLGQYLELVCSDDELQHIAELTALVDAHLDATTTVYEASATAAPEAKDEAWWHAANALWHASREYYRRSSGTDAASRLAGKHAKKKLGELTMEYELERSALMALKQCVGAYRATRPEND